MVVSEKFHGSLTHRKTTMKNFLNYHENLPPSLHKPVCFLHAVV